VLKRAGVAEVHDLTEGFAEWRKAGLAVRNGDHR
jgi:rhodanese-related sulfurtransferase